MDSILVRNSPTTVQHFSEEEQYCSIGLSSIAMTGLHCCLQLFSASACVG